MAHQCGAAAAARGRPPATSSSVSITVHALPIVYVLPEPVCPYANTVALYPLRQHERAAREQATAGGTARAYLRQASTRGRTSPYTS